MKKIIYYCDRCGKEIKGGNIKINPMYENLGPDRIQYVFEENCSRDYCMECAEEIQAFMLCTKNIKKKQEKEPTSEKIVNDTSKGKLDVGKVMALKKAGWTQAKIADEMGVSQSVISNALKAVTVSEPEEKNTSESM